MWTIEINVAGGGAPAQREFNIGDFLRKVPNVATLEIGVEIDGVPFSLNVSLEVTPRNINSVGGVPRKLRNVLESRRRPQHDAVGRHTSQYTTEPRICGFLSGVTTPWCKLAGSARIG